MWLGGKPKLQNDPQCGLATGGKEECFWDCPVLRFSNLTFLQITNEPSCLTDCFLPNSSVRILLNDYQKAGGICKGSFGDVFYTGVFPISNTVACDIDPASGLIMPGTGICSPAMQDALINDLQPIVLAVYSKPYMIYATLQLLTVSMCDAVAIAAIQDLLPNLFTRFPPVFNAVEYEGFRITTELEWENTRNRYPWICSLRSKSNTREHLCATTLLSRPPGPIVMVTSAHCTSLCKSEDQVVPNCCCTNVGNFTCDSPIQCGDSPSVVEMTGKDAEVICGEWETGSYSYSDSGEQYNLILPIQEIVRHPAYNISQEKNYVSNDIAVLKLDSSHRKEFFDTYNIYPACLPSGESKRDIGIHSGWSTPPDLDYMIQFATFFLPSYRDFFKQYHYKMDLVPCKDPITNWNENGSVLQHPSNSYYPPGSICAKEISLQFCPTKGESGSSLMVQNSSNNRFHTKGLLSFSKGCKSFDFGEIQNANIGQVSSVHDIGLNSTRYTLTQISINPSVYTRLSCYLPWIADQYGLELSSEIEKDDDCDQGTGNPEDDNVDECFNIPGQILINFPTVQDDVQTKCIFPFILNDIKYSTCILLDQNGFVTPVFRCPIRSVKNQKIGNSYSYTQDQLHFGDVWTSVNGYCPTNSHADPTQAGPPVIGANGLEELDPTNTDCDPSQLRPIFSTCSNNCPGGEQTFIISVIFPAFHRENLKLLLSLFLIFYHIILALRFYIQ